MSDNRPNARALIEAAQGEGLLPPEAGTAWRDARGPSAIVTALSFVGAQLVVLSFLAFLALAAYRFFFQSPTVFVAAAVLIGGGVGVLRARRGLFVEQMAFSTLLAGLVLMVIGFDSGPNNPMLLICLAVLVASAAAVRVAWVQAVLGFLAAGVALALVLVPLGFERLNAAGGRDEFLLLASYPLTFNAALLAVVWAVWVGGEARRAARPGAVAVHAFMAGVGVALLAAAGLAGAWLFGWVIVGGGAAPGSADNPSAGLATLIDFSAPVVLELALVLGAALWLWRHWRHGPSVPGVAGLLALVYAVLLVACFVVPHAGVVALVGTLALGTGRRALLALALAVLLGGLSGFYYALAWPLTHKAALLAAVGAALGVALWGLRTTLAQAPAVAADGSAGPRRAWAWIAPVSIAAGAALALTIVHFDVKEKERVLADGQKIFVPLAPRDPRSLMQGDYMALNFDFPPELARKLRQDEDQRLSSQMRVVARLDARGVATVLRLSSADEPLAAGELLLPLKRLKGDWVLVTDAFYFPEGQGQPLQAARFGEFRALADGRALLVGLADEHLQAIAPALPRPDEEKP